MLHNFIGDCFLAFAVLWGIPLWFYCLAGLLAALRGEL